MRPVSMKNELKDPHPFGVVRWVGGVSMKNELKASRILISPLSIGTYQ